MPCIYICQYGHLETLKVLRRTLGTKVVGDAWIHPDLGVDNSTRSTHSTPSKEMLFLGNGHLGTTKEGRGLPCSLEYSFSTCEMALIPGAAAWVARHGTPYIDSRD